MSTNQSAPERKLWGIERFVYTEAQIRGLILCYLRNNGSIQGTLVGSECLWEKRDWVTASFVAGFIDKIRAAMPSQEGPCLDLTADLILREIWPKDPAIQKGASCKTSG